jgi:hypothetical protein
MLPALLICGITATRVGVARIVKVSVVSVAQGLLVRTGALVVISMLIVTVAAHVGSNVPDVPGPVVVGRVSHSVNTVSPVPSAVSLAVGDVSQVVSARYQVPRIISMVVDGAVARTSHHAQSAVSIPSILVGIIIETNPNNRLFAQVSLNKTSQLASLQQTHHPPNLQSHCSGPTSCRPSPRFHLS